MLVNDEKFIDHNIANLAKEYSLTFGANINLARIVPSVIDGTKLVARRLLYIMFLKDRGRSFRKVAAITGDTIARLHMHGQCLHGDTKFLLTNGEKKKISELCETNASVEVFAYHNDEVVTAIAKDFRITDRYKMLYVITFRDGTSIECTAFHPFLVMRENKLEHKVPTWVVANEIKKGDLFYSMEIDQTNNTRFNIVQVKEVCLKIYPEKVPVYDFTVDTYENAYICLSTNDNKHSTVVAHNSSVEECLVGLAQWWNNNIPLIEGQGNFGSCSGDKHGASRYIQARLSEYAYECFFADWKDSVVDMIMGADGETKEPLYLPAKYPNILLNGSLGIGYTKASNLPPFNFKEVVEATIKLMKNPNSSIFLIPDSPTGSDIVAGNFKKICEVGTGVYKMRCSYDISDDKNMIVIKTMPYQVAVNTIRERIADIKESGGLPQLVSMHDYSGNTVDLRLVIRSDVNPYKFMRKLIEEVNGLEKSYPVNITVTNDYQSFDYSVKDILIEWIKYRREQKRTVTNHRRTRLLAEQRTNDVKLFLMSENNLQDTINLFKSSRNRIEIERRLIEVYKHSEIRMDSLQAKTLSELKMHELSIESYEACLKRKDELEKELKDVNNILSDKDGIDNLIIGELTDGIKRFGKPRKSNVVPYKISTDQQIDDVCILQLSSDGILLRKIATNVDDEPIPIDNNGFAVKVENDNSFIVVDEMGYHSLMKVKEIPVDQEVPINRYLHNNLKNIAGLLPYDIDSEYCCTLISQDGIMKKIRISDMKISKRPCISLSKTDKLVRVILTKENTQKDLLIYTRMGMGQRLDPNNIKVTSPLAKGSEGFKLQSDDKIVGSYIINPSNQYLLYVTTQGKVRLNATKYLPTRNSKRDEMVKLITLPDRDKLVAVVGCNKFDKCDFFFDDGGSERIDISTLEEGTMGTEPKKVTSKSALSFNIVKVKII
jgi:DNA gyrase subunit A